MALLSFSHCFVGTTKGFDEFYPKNINVVKDLRLYESKTNTESTYLITINLYFFFLVKHSFIRDDILIVIFYTPKDPYA